MRALPKGPALTILPEREQNSKIRPSQAGIGADRSAYQNRSLEPQAARTMSTQQLAQPGLEVWQPNGNIAYRANAAEVDRLLRTKQAKPQFGRDKRMKALRLKVAIPVRVEEPGRPMAFRGVPPSKSEPSRWFWWQHAVYADMRESPQRSAGQAALRALRAEEKAAKESSNAERIKTRRA